MFIPVISVYIFYFLNKNVNVENHLYVVICVDLYFEVPSKLIASKISLFTCVYLLCIYIYKYTHTVYILKIFTFILYIDNYFLLYTCVCVYMHIINRHSTHVLCKQKLLCWMRLIV